LCTFDAALVNALSELFREERGTVEAVIRKPFELERLLEEQANVDRAVP